LLEALNDPELDKPTGVGAGPAAEEEEQEMAGAGQQEALEELEVEAAKQEALEDLEARGAHQEAPEGSSSDEGEDGGGHPQVNYMLVKF
jgi:hypothetical protein